MVWFHHMVESHHLFLQNGGKSSYGGDPSYGVIQSFLQNGGKSPYGGDPP